MLWMHKLLVNNVKLCITQQVIFHLTTFYQIVWVEKCIKPVLADLMNPSQSFTDLYLFLNSVQLSMAARRECKVRNTLYSVTDCCLTSYRCCKPASCCTFVIKHLLCLKNKNVAIMLQKFNVILQSSATLMFSCKFKEHIVIQFTIWKKNQNRGDLVTWLQEISSWRDVVKISMKLTH